MTIDVTSTFADFLADNRGPDPNDPDHLRMPNYGIVARLAGHVLEVELVFRCGSAYCCYEWGCHLALRDGQRWGGLRRRMSTHNIVAPPRIELLLTCVIEEGAIFFDFGKRDSTRRGWYTFAPVSAHRYQRRVVEAATLAEENRAEEEK